MWFFFFVSPSACLRLDQALRNFIFSRCAIDICPTVGTFYFKLHNIYWYSPTLTPVLVSSVIDRELRIEKKNIDRYEILKRALDFSFIQIFMNIFKMIISRGETLLVHVSNFSWSSRSTYQFVSKYASFPWTSGPTKYYEVSDKKALFQWGRLRYWEKEDAQWANRFLYVFMEIAVVPNVAIFIALFTTIKSSRNPKPWKGSSNCNVRKIFFSVYQSVINFGVYSLRCSQKHRCFWLYFWKAVKGFIILCNLINASQA